MVSEKGSTAVEFAMIIPILLGLTLTVVVLGDIFITYARVNTIVREAARVGSEIGKKDSGVGVANAQRWATNLYNSVNPDCSSWSFGATGTARGEMFTAHATCEHPLIFNPAGVLQALAEFSGGNANLNVWQSGSILIQSVHSFRIQKHKARFP